MSTPWFDEISLSYARHHDEVEAARSGFGTQRQSLLDRFARSLSEAIATTTLKTVDRRESKDDGWETLWLSGAFWKARKEAGTGEKQSAICVGIAHDASFVNDGGGCFGFGAYVFFKMNKKRYDQVRTTLTSVGAPVDYAFEDGNAYVRSAWIKPDSDRFRLDVFDEEIARLPDVFLKADELVGAAYRKVKFG